MNVSRGNTDAKLTETLPRYVGKSSDSTGVVFSMLLGSFGIDVRHAECLTGRPFGFRITIDNSENWLVPWLEPWEGLLCALRTAGVSSWRAESGGDAATLLKVGSEWISDGPVAVGPLNPLAIWNRLEPHFYQGGSHWLVIVKKIGDVFVVHDTEGCPFGRVLRLDIERALSACQSERGVLQVVNATPLAEPDKTLTRCIIDGAKLRRGLRNEPIFGANGLRCLAKSLAGRQLRAKESASLSYGFPAMGTSRFLVAALIAELAQTDPAWRPTWTRVLHHADDLCRMTAIANRKRGEGQGEAISQILKQLSNIEADFDLILEDAPCS